MTKCRRWFQPFSYRVSMLSFKCCSLGPPRNALALVPTSHTLPFLLSHVTMTPQPLVSWEAPSTPASDPLVTGVLSSWTWSLPGISHSFSWFHLLNVSGSVSRFFPSHHFQLYLSMCFVNINSHVKLKFINIFSVRPSTNSDLYLRV